MKKQVFIRNWIDLMKKPSICLRLDISPKMTSTRKWKVLRKQMFSTDWIDTEIQISISEWIALSPTK